VGGYRADEDGAVADSEALAVGKLLLIGRKLEVRRKRIEPVFGPINLGEWLNALAATWKVLVVIIGVLPVRQPPLAEITDTLDGLSFLFGPTERWQKEAGKQRDDCNNDQKLDQREAQTGMPCSRHRFRRCARRRQAVIVSPNVPRARAVGSGTAMIV